MLKRMLKVVCFNILLLLMLSPILLSGELLDVDLVIDLQSKAQKEMIFGTAYYDSTDYYKLEMAKKKSAPILALGTSRVMQIKKEFFTKKDIFYNTGGGYQKSRSIPIL